MCHVSLWFKWRKWSAIEYKFMAGAGKRGKGEGGQFIHVTTTLFKIYIYWRCILPLSFGALRRV